ncbi:septum formation family protein [Nocardioides sp. Bht2]|uniref:septum formation family protein n=1 Tax=Nocardioides sp. Bht2 TaxID=3392297 RepID=UPI0039B4FE29
MAVRHLRILAVAALSGSLFGLAACGADPATPKPEPAVMGPAVIHAEPTPTLSPRAGAPTMGACYRLSAADLAASTNASSPVPCTDPHNTMTIRVGLFPTTMKLTEPEYAQRLCARRLPKTTGLTQAALAGTIFAAHWFGPNADQRAAGARWFRCDIVAKVDTGTGTGTKPLPRTAAPLFNGEAPGGYVRCVRRTKGSTTDARYVTCDKPHDYRWAGSFQAAGTRYPGADGLRELVEERCPRYVGRSAFWFTHPVRASWRNGDRTVHCYRPTS